VADNGDLHAAKYTEIFPLDKFSDCSDVANVKCEPDTLKVGDVFAVHFSYIFRAHTYTYVF